MPIISAQSFANENHKFPFDDYVCDVHVLWPRHSVAMQIRNEKSKRILLAYSRTGQSYGKLFETHFAPLRFILSVGEHRNTHIGIAIKAHVNLRGC